MRLIMLLISICFMFAGCQKNNEYENISKIRPDMAQIHKIISEKTQNYFKSNDFIINSSEMDILVKSLDNITSNVKELQQFKKVMKDDDLYTALKILTNLELMTLLSDKDIKLSRAAEMYYEMVRFSTKQLISLKKTGIDIRQYIKDYEKLNCIGAACGHINEIIMTQNIAYNLKSVSLESKDKKILNKFLLKQSSLWGIYLFNSDGIDRRLYRNIESNYINYLKEKNIYTKDISDLMDELTKYKVRKAMVFVYTGKLFPVSYFTDKKYYKNILLAQSKSDNISDEEIEGKRRIREELVPVICSYPELLYDESKKECIDYLNKNSFDDILLNMQDENINDGRAYIIIDDEVCMIKDNTKQKFYSSNEFCKVLKAAANRE